MRLIDRIVVHCADTPNGKAFTVEDIDAWHKERGWHRKPENMARFNINLQAIGYHAVIYIDGSLHTGRGEFEVGAHAEGYNTNSLGVCLIGHDRFTPPQWKTLKQVILDWRARFPIQIVNGHYEITTSGKTCPNFDVAEYLRMGYTPAKKNVLI